MGLTTYRGPGENDPSLGGRFREDEGEDEVELSHENEGQDEQGPRDVASVLGKRARENANEEEDYRDDLD